MTVWKRLKPLRVRLLLLLAVVGPGIITANVDNDAGGITTYSVAGAHYGYSLLWMLLLVTLALIIGPMIFLFHQCYFSPDVSFIYHHSGASWIRYPEPVSTFSRRYADLTYFSKDFFLGQNNRTNDGYQKQNRGDLKRKQKGGEHLTTDQLGVPLLFDDVAGQWSVGQGDTALEHDDGRVEKREETDNHAQNNLVRLAF